MVPTVFSEDQQRRKNMEEEDQTTIHLLPHESREPHFDCRRDGTAREVDAEVVPGDSSVTTVLVLSTVIPICGSLNYGLAAGYSSPAESGIVDDLHLSTAEYSLFGSLLTIGGAIGAIVSGRLADYLGRRLTLGVTDLFAIIGWLSIAVSQTAWSLDLGRLLLGISLGLTAYVVPVYVAEITPKDRRGQFVVFHMFMIVTGISVAFLLGVIISWRLLAVVGIIPSLVQLIGVFMIPESPRWLAKIGKSDEFEAALQRLRGVNVDITEEAAEIKEYTDSLKQISEVNILQLFQRKYAYVLTVGVGLFALSQLMGTNGILYYASSVFESAGFSGHVGSIALAVIQIPAVFVPVVCMDKFGRRVLLMVSAAGLCFGCFLAGLAYVFEDFGLLKGVSPYMVLIGVLIYAFMYPVGMGATIFLIIAEIYPLNIKGLAGSMATLAGWLCSWFVAYTFNFSMEWSSAGTFFILAGICAFTLLFIAILVPETKGRTLEDIQASINHIWQRNEAE